ncbi:MAG: WG repeat-containing protein [Paludibacteraceae bacterium]|nr:WG repeat-containing protein [Paludibacteraceae bacterium]
MKAKLFSFFAVVSLLLSAIIVLNACKDKTTKRQISDNLVEVTTGTTTTIVDAETGKKLIKNIKVDWVNTNDYDTLGVFCKDDKRGYFNVFTGEIIIEPQYRRAWVFSEGLAAVEKDGYIGFINSSGETVLPFSYPYKGHCLSEFVFHDGRCAVADSTRRLGVIDKSGNWLIKPDYDDVQLGKDYAVVYKKGEFKRQIDYSGRVILDCVIDYVSRICYTTHFENKETGEIERIELTSDDFFEYNVGSRAGLMDRFGHFLTMPVYTDIIGLNATTFRAILQDGHSEVLIDSKGNVLSRK